MADDREIMQLPLHVLPDSAKTTAQRGHFARPGTGPEGETCGTCRHYTVKSGDTSKPYRKCGKALAKWTRGPGSDIRKKDPSCHGWEKSTD